MRKILFISALTFCSVLGWSADWLTDGGDSQRTHWQKDEKLISPASAKNLKLLWKIQLDAKPRVMSNLFTALITNRVTRKRDRNRSRWSPRSPTSCLRSMWMPVRFSGRSSSAALPAIIRRSRTAIFFAPAGRPRPLISIPLSPGKYTVYAVSGDGLLHQLNLGDGEDIAPPTKFVPPGGKSGR